MSLGGHQNKPLPSYVKFITGGAAGVTSVYVIHPFDLIKNRLQTQSSGAQRLYKSAFHCFRTVLVKEGPLALYTGLGASVLRQATYTTTRLGIYSYFDDFYKRKYMTDANVFSRMAMGLAAGGVGAFVGTPADVVLIRMTADGGLPAEKRRNYKNVIDGTFRIVREEGAFTLFRGCVPTVTRAMLVTMVQLASYSTTKTHLINSGMKDNIGVHFLASFISGFLTSVTTMPVDLAKTTIQYMKYVDGKPEYKGTMDVIYKVVHKDGLLALWKGFTPYYMKVGTQTMLILVLLEQYTKLYKTYIIRYKE